MHTADHPKLYLSPSPSGTRSRALQNLTPGAQMAFQDEIWLVESPRRHPAPAGSARPSRPSNHDDGSGPSHTHHPVVWAVDPAALVPSDEGVVAWGELQPDTQRAGETGRLGRGFPAPLRCGAVRP